MQVYLALPVLMLKRMPLLSPKAGAAGTTVVGVEEAGEAIVNREVGDLCVECVNVWKLRALLKTTDEIE